MGAEGVRGEAPARLTLPRGQLRRDRHAAVIDARLGIARRRAVVGRHDDDGVAPARERRRPGGVGPLGAARRERRIVLAREEDGAFAVARHVFLATTSRYGATPDSR